MEKIEVKSRAELRLWLRANHKQMQIMWLITYKKSKLEYYLNYDSIVEEILCFSWIDSLPRALDNERTMLRISPRRPASAWSKINRTRVYKLINNGLMTSAGMAIINQAKRNGSWTKLKSLLRSRVKWAST